MFLSSVKILGLPGKILSDRQAPVKQLINESVPLLTGKNTANELVFSYDVRKANLIQSLKLILVFSYYRASF